MLAPFPELIASLAPAVRDAARQAGTMAMTYFRSGSQTAARLWYKERSSPVTEADIALDVFLKEHLCRLLPQAGWLSEETADSPERLEQDDPSIRHERAIDHDEKQREANPPGACAAGRCDDGARIRTPEDDCGQHAGDGDPQQTAGGEQVHSVYGREFRV